MPSAFITSSASVISILSDISSILSSCINNEPFLISLEIITASFMRMFLLSMFTPIYELWEEHKYLTVQILDYYQIISNQIKI